MDRPSNPHALSARQAGLVACQGCHLLCRIPRSGMGGARCPRCSGRLHPRKPYSLSRTWACILAAAICYIPANVLPITYVSTLGHVQADTILSGVIYFAKTGSWPIAFVIFTASMVVPLMKMIVLIYL